MKVRHETVMQGGKVLQTVWTCFFEFFEEKKLVS